MPGPRFHPARLRDLLLLFLTGLFGIPGTLVLIARIVSRNTVYTIFAGSSMTSRRREYGADRDGGAR